MPCLKPVSTAAILAVLSAPAAFADVTGAQVWSDMKDYMQSFGYQMTATESQSGGTLVVSDIAMSMELPENEGTMAISLGALTFTDNSDGTVNVGFPAQMPMTFDVTPATGESASGTLLVEQAAPVMIVSGDPGDFTYTYSAETVTMTLQDFQAEGESVPRDVFSMVMGMNDLSSKTRTKVGDMRSYDGQFSAASLTYDISFNVPDGPEQGSGSFKGTMNGLTANSTAIYPQGMNSSDMAEMIAAGVDIGGTMTYTGGSTDIQAVSPDGPFSANTSSTGGALTFAMNGDGLRYDIRGTGVAINAQVPDFPFPVSLNMAESAFTFGIPLAVSEEPQSFAFGFKFGEFTVSDVLWSLFDPGAQLPRDPATLELDLTGTAKVQTDIFDPMAMAGNEAPGEINSLNINTLLVDLVGARLIGSGAFSFDNTDTTTFDGMPRPEGALDLRLEGANKLIDTLVGMGLLPQEQAMGARMMMGLFGVPQGDDTLTSKIEVNAEGHVLANGQRLQ